MSPLKILGATSGYSQISAPDAAGDQTFTLPGTGGTLDRLNRAGNILQVVSATKTDTTSTASTTFVDLTGLSVSITPTSASNKIYVTFTVTGAHSGVSDIIAFQLVRDSTALAVGDAASTRPRSTNLLGMSSNAYNLVTASHAFLDSPASTSSLTYKVQYRVKTGTGYINRTAGDADGVDSHRTSSTITVMEVAA